jgi:hypothetical protein
MSMMRLGDQAYVILYIHICICKTSRFENGVSGYVKSLSTQYCDRLTISFCICYIGYNCLSPELLRGEYNSNSTRESHAA